MTNEPRDPRVPYAQIEAAEQVAAQAFPDAISIKGIWTPSSSESDVAVEVEHDRGRKSTWRPRTVRRQHEIASSR